MFIEKLLPKTGLYCVAKLTDRLKFKHYFFSSLDEAQKKIDALNAYGRTVFLAQATFDPEKIAEAVQHNKTHFTKETRKKERSHDNAVFLRNFFIDIDCGEKWPLKNQKEGVAALKELVSATGLPFPAVVNSGNGLYAHWLLVEDVSAQKWLTVARLLKQVINAYVPELGGDSSRTSDHASVLRPPGTTNRKPGKPEKNVVLLKDMEPVEFLQFVELLEKAAKKKKVDCTAVKPPAQSDDINSECFALQTSITLADRIADKCAQVALFRSSTADITEPMWYSFIGVVANCVDSDDVIQKWSEDNPRWIDGSYNPKATADKIAQWRASGVGPTTCAHLGGLNPDSCIGCPHNGKIKSPIVLGVPEPEAVETPSDQCSAPDGYRRTKDGLYVEQDGRWIRFYDQDLYPVRLAYDESLGYEVTLIRHTLPFEGELECTIRSSVVNDPKTLITLLSDNHIKVLGAREKKYMNAYLEAYQVKLQRERRMSMLLCQMGWKNARNGAPIFVLGKKIFHADGSIEEANLANNVPAAAEGFHAAGSLEKWVEATAILDKPGMEPFAFALLAGGFGAPLMKFTGYDGALVSLEGASGAGKTLMLRWIHSVWGYHKDLMMLRDDTKNSLISRLGVYGNLPLTIDEVTNVDGMELSNLVYQITQGRDKARLTKSSEEKKTLNSWNTLAVVSSNASLVDKLSGAKHDASAEINRVFEYRVDEHPLFKGDTTTDIYWTLHSNYGHAGEIYAKWLAQNESTIASTMKTIRERIECSAEIKGEERFWGAIASASIYSGLVAQKLGLIRFDVSRVLEWVSKKIWSMRETRVDMTGDSVGILGQFIDDHAGNRLLIRGHNERPQDCIIVEQPKGSLVIRYEIDSGVMYLSRAVFKQWLAKRFGNYTQIKRELVASKVLIDSNKRKVLGAGTPYGGTQQVCWVLNMSNPAVEKGAVQLIETAKMLNNM